MNIGLLLLIGNLLFGGDVDDKADSVKPNNKLKRFNHKINSFVDYSGHITEPANNDSLEAGITRQALR